MPKANVQLLKRKTFKPFVREVVTPNHPDGKFVFTLRTLDALDALNWVSLGDDLFNQLQFQPLPPLGDQPIIVSKSACQMAMILDIAQCPPNIEDKYDATEILMMMTDSECLSQIGELSMEVQGLSENAGAEVASSDPLPKRPRRSAARS